MTPFFQIYFLLLFLDRPQAIKFDGLRPVKKQEQKVNLKEGSHLSPHGQSSPETTYTAGFRLLSSLATLDLRRGYATSCPPNQVNDSKKGSNGAAGCRSGNLHSERGVGSGLAGAPYPESSEVPSG